MKKFILMILSALICFAFTSCGEDPAEAVQRKITFTQTGYDAIVKYVEDGKDLTDIPKPNPKTGYTVKWSIQNFEDITQDLTIKAVEKANEYKVHYEIGDRYGASVGAKYTVVTFDSAYELLTPSCPGYKFAGWAITGTEEMYTASEKYTVAGDTYLTAVWKPADDYVNPFL